MYMMMKDELQCRREKVQVVHFFQTWDLLSDTATRGNRNIKTGGKNQPRTAGWVAGRGKICPAHSGWQGSETKAALAEDMAN